MAPDVALKNDSKDTHPDTHRNQTPNHPASRDIPEEFLS